MKLKDFVLDRLMNRNRCKCGNIIEPSYMDECKICVLENLKQNFVKIRQGFSGEEMQVWDKIGEQIDKLKEAYESGSTNKPSNI